MLCRAFNDKILNANVFIARSIYASTTCIRLQLATRNVVHVIINTCKNMLTVAQSHLQIQRKFNLPVFSSAISVAVCYTLCLRAIFKTLKINSNSSSWGDLMMTCIGKHHCWVKFAVSLKVDGVVVKRSFQQSAKVLFIRECSQSRSLMWRRSLKSSKLRVPSLIATQTIKLTIILQHIASFK